MCKDIFQKCLEIKQNQDNQLKCLDCHLMSDAWRLMTIKLIIRSETTETPLKMMKNAFYFTLKTLFVLKIFKFLSSLLSHAEKLA